MSSAREQDLYDNADAKVRYEAYRCEFSRYEAYRWASHIGPSRHFVLTIWQLGGSTDSDMQSICYPDVLLLCAAVYRQLLLHMVNLCPFLKLWQLGDNLMARAVSWRHSWALDSISGKAVFLSVPCQIGYIVKGAYVQPAQHKFCIAVILQTTCNMVHICSTERLRWELGGR